MVVLLGSSARAAVSCSTENPLASSQAFSLSIVDGFFLWDPPYIHTLSSLLSLLFVSFPSVLSLVFLSIHVTFSFARPVQLPSLSRSFVSFSYVSSFLNLPLLYKFFLFLPGLDGHFPISDREPQSRRVYYSYSVRTSASQPPKLSIAVTTVNTSSRCQCLSTAHSPFPTTPTPADIQHRHSELRSFCSSVRLRC